MSDSKEKIMLNIERQKHADAERYLQSEVRELQEKLRRMELVMQREEQSVLQLDGSADVTAKT